MMGGMEVGRSRSGPVEIGDLVVIWCAVSIIKTLSLQYYDRFNMMSLDK